MHAVVGGSSGKQAALLVGNIRLEAATDTKTFNVLTPSRKSYLRTAKLRLVNNAAEGVAEV